MMRFYQQKLAILPDPERYRYLHAVRSFRGLLCGSSALPAPIQKFWKAITAGKGILTRYGGTEFGAPIKVGPDDQDVPEGSVGKADIGLDVKLSDGDEGEIQIRSPHMFGR
jgi:malonyl-CoA/methylmalonyl-CoA synthetase